MRIPIRQGNVRSLEFTWDLARDCVTVIVRGEDGHDLCLPTHDKRAAYFIPCASALSATDALAVARGVLTPRQWSLISRQLQGEGADNG